MFNPTILDEVCVQATHLESRGKNITNEGRKKPFKGKKNRRPQKVKEKRMHMSRKREKKWSINIVQVKAMMKIVFGNYILKRGPNIIKTKGNKNCSYNST